MGSNEEVKKILGRVLEVVSVGDTIFIDNIAREICQLFEPGELVPEGAISEIQKDKDGNEHLVGYWSSEPKPDYTLSCDNCGKPFSSTEGFPSPQLCPECQPKPVESRFPDDKYIERAITIQALEKHKHEFLSHYNMDDALEICKEIRDLTASILKGEYDKLVLEAYDKGYKLACGQMSVGCQQRVERIFREIEDSRLQYRRHQDGTNHYCPNCDLTIVGMTVDCWQALKKQEGIGG